MEIHTFSWFYQEVLFFCSSIISHRNSITLLITAISSSFGFFHLKAIAPPPHTRCLFPSTVTNIPKCEVEQASHRKTCRKTFFLKIGCFLHKSIVNKRGIIPVIGSHYTNLKCMLPQICLRANAHYLCPFVFVIHFPKGADGYVSPFEKQRNCAAHRPAFFDR